MMRITSFSLGATALVVLSTACGSEGEVETLPAGLMAAMEASDEMEPMQLSAEAPGTADLPVCTHGKRRWRGTNADVDPSFVGITGGHAVWAPDFLCGGTTTWSGDALRMVAREDGTGYLMGGLEVDPEVCGGAYAGDEWRMRIVFDGDDEGLALPKTELPSPHVNQPPELTDTWEYFLIREGSAWIWNENTGEYAVLTHRPELGEEPFFGYQLGTAANNKNLSLGMSVWFFYEFHAADGTVRHGYGDVNLNLAPLCVDEAE